MGTQFPNGTTDEELDEPRDDFREDQQQWWEAEFSEQHLCAMFPAADNYFRSLHMECQCG